MVYSHLNPDIRLEDHLMAVGEKCKSFIKRLNLNLETCKTRQLARAAYIVGITHDFGKSTKFFQDVLGNRLKSHRYSNHALISSLLAHQLVQWDSPEASFLPVCAYLSVRYHHQNLRDPESEIKGHQLTEVREQWGNIREKQWSQICPIYDRLLLPLDLDRRELFDRMDGLVCNHLGDFVDDLHKSYWQDNYGLETEDRIEVFLISNLLFSVLVDADKREAAELDLSRFEGSTQRTLDIAGYLDHMRRKDPDHFDPTLPLNEHRNRFFSQVSNHEDLTSHNHLYTITAPTGIGKTFAACQAASRLKDRLGDERRIVYALPFTAIIDQNYDELKKVAKWQYGAEIGEELLLKHHYLALADRKDEQGEMKYASDPARYLKDRLVTETWERGYVVTTFVQLFHSIITGSNRFLKKFHNLVNGILVLDEVQNLPAGYHGLTRAVFKVLAERFDTYFILMTATQPEIFSDLEAVELANPESYFQLPVLNRVVGEYIRPGRRIPIENFLELFRERFEGDSALVVGNTRRSTLKLYEDLVDEVDGEYKVYCLTTYLTPSDRADRIKKLKCRLEDGEKLICVATQLVEAGVDLSFEYVFRDLGPFDSIVQVAGRCNRHGELSDKGVFYVMELESTRGHSFAARIYDTKILQMTRQLLEATPSFESKDFLGMSSDFFSRFQFEIQSKRLLRALENLSYQRSYDDRDPISSFELIEDTPEQIDIVVCTGRAIEADVWRIDELLTELQDVNRYSDEGEALFGEMVLLKKKLASHSVTVYEKDRDPYRKSADLRKTPEAEILHVPYNSCGNVYSAQMGFDPDPNPEDLTTSVVW